jgi:hypothetical protein
MGYGMWSRAGAFAAALLLAAVGAPPAWAGALPELSCASQSLSPEQAAVMRSALTGNSGDLPAARRAGDAAIAGCRLRFGWTEAEAEAAHRVLAGQVQQAGYRGDLEALGVDHAWIESEVIADDALVAAALGMQPVPPALASFIARMESRRPALRRSSPATKTAIGGFLFSTASIEGWRRRFLAAAPPPVES